MINMYGINNIYIYGDIQRKVNAKLSWKIPLQIVDCDANKLKSMLGRLDNLKSAMIVGTTSLGAQFTSKKVGQYS